jgi:hypothetical protein
MPRHSAEEAGSGTYHCAGGEDALLEIRLASSALPEKFIPDFVEDVEHQLSRWITWYVFQGGM